jgi:hypothetical protein
MVIVLNGFQVFKIYILEAPEMLMGFLKLFIIYYVLFIIYKIIFSSSSLDRD